MNKPLNKLRKGDRIRFPADPTEGFEEQFGVYFGRSRVNKGGIVFVYVNWEDGGDIGEVPLQADATVEVINVKK